MNSNKRLIEPEDLDRLRRLNNAAGALLETGHDNERVEKSLAQLSKYKDHFLILFQRVSESDSKHQAQQTVVNDLEARLKQNQNELAETKGRLNSAVDASDVDSASILNARLPVLQLTVNNLETKLEESRQELARGWQAFDTARSHVSDLRTQVDRDSSHIEWLVREVKHANDPRLEEIRARHQEMLNPRKEAGSPAQPEPTRIIHLTRRTDELPIQVTRSSEP